VPHTAVSLPRRLASSPHTQTHTIIRYMINCTINLSNQKTIILCQPNSYDTITDCSSKFPCEHTVKNTTDVIIGGEGGEKKYAHTDSICDLAFQVQK